jgi:asparagine synthase (glutamine-hydrolysing)
MATSLETRVPMLDPDVYRLAWSLPLEYRMNAGTGKVVVRELLSRSVPRHLFERPKQGFGIPLDSWLRGPLREWAERLLDPAVMRAQGHLDADVVQRHWREHLEGSRNWQHRLWYVLMFQGWLARWG